MVSVAENRILRAGPLTAEFADGNLRNLRWHGREAIRAISYLVRDENWGNYPVAIEKLDIEEGDDNFSIACDARTRSRSGATLTIRAEISGHADGRLVFDARALTDADFVTNRCGFCILHPIVGVAGSRAIVEHIDGTIEHAHFPDAIDPAQPFLDIRAITHDVALGVTAECRMEGGTFEMEDQRSWTDASFKTYVRPLALPWPYTIAEGSTDHQRITLTLRGEPEGDTASADGPVRLTVGSPLGMAVPAFGLGIRPSDLAATLHHLDALREITPQHLILHFNPLEGHSAEELAGYAKLVDAFPAAATLEFVLPCQASPAEELRAAARLVAASGLQLSALAVCPAPDLKSTPPGSVWPACPPLEAIYTAARTAFPGLRLGGGMFSYFTELNRKRPPVGMLDFITHTTAPLVHAADDRSVLETLEALPYVTRSVRAFAGRMPYRIGPSSIGMRQNPYGAGLNANPDGARITMTEHDPRQKQAFAAAWLVGYAAATVDAGLEMLALGSLTGPLGVLDDRTRFPAFEAVKAISHLSGLQARRVTSSDPSSVLALAGGDTVLVANLTPEPRQVTIGRTTLALAPHGFARHSLETS